MSVKHLPVSGNGTVQARGKTSEFPMADSGFEVQVIFREALAYFSGVLRKCGETFCSQNKSHETQT